MFDGYRTYNLSVNIDELIKNSLLSFDNIVSNDSGEIKTAFAKYKGQTFSIKNNNISLRGSFHTYFNNGEYNYNDFYYSDFINVMNDYVTKFNINLQLTKLNNLEFGVNVIAPIEPNEIFKNIVNYKGNPFHKFNIDGAKGIECETQRFIIKIYDKGYQYNQKGYLLRYEIKVRKMQYFKENKINIKTLADLLNIDVINPLKDILKSVFNDILFTDYNINTSNLSMKERLKLSDGNNPKYWEHLLPKTKLLNGSINKDYNKQRKKYYRELNNFKNIINKNSTSTLQSNISNLIENKCIQLLNSDYKKGDKLTEILEPNKIIKRGQINTLSIGLICTPKEQRFCLTCNKDISLKKEGAKFCCKKCKNDFTNPLLNPKNNLVKRIKNLDKNILPLFDYKKYIVLNEMQKQLINSENSIYN